MKITGANEAAFPRPCGKANDFEQNLETDGVTCLEWYAAQAMQALIAQGCVPFATTWDKMARLAFDAAEAMVAEARRRRDEQVARFREENPDEE